MGAHKAEHSIEIKAPPQACYDVIVDYESWPGWQRSVKGTVVHESNAAGLGKIVEVHVDLLVREVVYTLDYDYEAPKRVWWTMVEAEMVKGIEGDFTFEPTKSGTRATYRLEIDPGFPVPGPLARRVSRESMKRMLADFKKETERRSGG